MTVAALYIDPRGPYPKLLGPEMCWGADRDALTYPGPWPVVAHPPCGPWGQLRHLCTKQRADLAPAAVEQVRRYGGVLEHPRGSKLWEHCALPKPGAPPDAFGGYTIEVEQVRWGHVARKPTWLYLVGVRDVGASPPPREPTHWIGGSRDPAKGGPGHGRGLAPAHVKFASAQQRRRTPVAFAEYLISLAEQAC